MGKVLKCFIIVIASILATTNQVYSKSIEDIIGTYYPGEKKIISFPESVWGNGNRFGGVTSSRDDLVEVWESNSTGATLKILKAIPGRTTRVSITVDYYEASKNYKRESYVFNISIKTNPIEMTESSISLSVGETHWLKYKGTVVGKPVPDATWETSKNSVASVSTTGNVTAKSAGTTTITATSKDGEQTICKVTVTGNSTGGSGGGSTSDEMTAEVVDLGLSVKWTTCNLGASTPTGLGNNYAWGATKPSYSNTDDSPGTTWCYDDELERAGVIKNGHFAPEFDACTQALGAKYRVPTIEEWQELSDNCTWVAQTISGTPCLKGTSKKNGKTIILPRTVTTSPGTSLEGHALNSWSCTHYYNGQPWAYYAWANISKDGAKDGFSYSLYDNVRACRTLRAVYDPSAGVEEVIKDVNRYDENRSANVYNLQGICVRRKALTLEGLPSGIYIYKGRKVCL